jgi:tetratricopeptide (TPR) repeat protein
MKVSAFDPEDLANLSQGDITPEEKRRAVRRLLSLPRLPGGGAAGQPARLSASQAPSASTRKEPVGELGDLRLSERALQLLREHARVPELLARLDGLSPEDRKSLVRTDPELQSWPLGQRLVESCLDLVYAEAAKAEELAELVIALSQGLDARRYGAELVCDFKAKAWACLGEVLRSRTDLRSADEAFVVAEKLLASGTGDVLEEARLLELKATLRRDQLRLDEAHGLLDDVLAVYRQFRDFHQVGRALVQKGSVYGAANEFEPAVRWLRKGLGLIDPTRERRLELSARQSLMLYLHESGRDQEAWFLLKASRPEFVEHGGELLKLRLRWLEGKIQQSLERFAEAEEALVEARRGFIEQGAGFGAALVCLDLAGLYAAQSRAGEMRHLVEEMLPIFQSRDIHREAIAALIVFQQAVRMEKLSSDLLDEIRSFLRRARTDHKLRFEYPA